MLFYQDSFGSPSKVGYASLGFTYDSIHGELFSGGMNCGVLNTKIINMSGTTDDPNSEINYKGTKATYTMIKFIDNFSNSYQKLIIGITSGEFYITKTNYNGVVMLDYDKEKITHINFELSIQR